VSGGERATARLKAESIAVSLRGRVVLDGVSTAIPGGRLVGLIGPNGAGKTTLLRVLAGLTPADRGGVHVDGRPLERWNRRALARMLAYLPQRGVAHWPLTVRRLVLLGRLPHGAPWGGISAADRAAAEHAMARLGIGHLAERPIASLSGGEAALALIARALAVGAPILVVDEPVAALDPFHQLQVMELLREEAARGVAVLAVLHDLSLASRFCDDLVLLHEGRVLTQGRTKDVLTPEAIARAYAVTAWRGEAAGERFVLPWRRLSADDATSAGSDRNRRG
jgi:iron complex transport system ATP-binding protein